jgi:hypothetical protein
MDHFTKDWSSYEFLASLSQHPYGVTGTINDIEEIISLDVNALEPTPIGNSQAITTEAIISHPFAFESVQQPSRASSLQANGRNHQSELAIPPEICFNCALEGSSLEPNSIKMGKTTGKLGELSTELSDATSITHHPTGPLVLTSDAISSSGSNPELREPKFRVYQKEKWSERFEEFQRSFDKRGHSQVPNSSNGNKQLARWVKRQRYQYRLRKEGTPSAMTDERIEALEKLGFVWDSHGAAWEDRLKELEKFKSTHRHCNVPSCYPQNSSLASWIKCQRRQYRLFREGKDSNMTMERIIQLEKMGFQWDIRASKMRSWQYR